MPRTINLSDLRRYALARSLFKPTTLPRAIARLGFVQMDPIRAPARAQDLTLRHRVVGYRAGDMERRYAQLPVEEDFFVNYGIVPRATHLLMHPRTPRTVWPATQWAQAHAVLAYVHERGVAHPREVDAQFQHGKALNWFGGSSNASTQLLDGMHYRGLLRVAGRSSGTRTYAPGHTQTQTQTQTQTAASDPQTPHLVLDALVDVVVQKYAPLPERSLCELINHLRAAVPQWAAHRASAQQRAKARLSSCGVDGVRWYWPADENPASRRYAMPETEAVRLLAPFDPVVWDRRRFELLWGWAYRFEAYTPAPQRVRGYYALPLLWRDQVIGWGNLAWRDGALSAELGYVSGKAPRGLGFKQALDEELQRVTDFLKPR